MENEKLIEIDKSIVELQEELQKLNKLNESLKVNSESAKAAIESAERMSSLLSEVVEGNNELIKQGKGVFAEIQEVDFPKRLEKVDKSITAISVSVQNVLTASQSIDAKIEKFGKVIDEKLDGVDKSVNDRIKESSVSISRGGNLRKKLLIAIIAIQIIIGSGIFFFAIPKLCEHINKYSQNE